MLKIVGTSHGKVVDEKILIDDSNKITKYGDNTCCYNKKKR